MTFEELKKQFIDNGFQVDENKFTHTRVNTSVNINGMHPTEKFEMQYLGEGSICDADASDSDVTVLHEFDIMQNGNPVLTICIENFEDFTRLV